MFFATHLSHPDPLRQRLAEHDWSNSVLGPIDRWPPAIRTVLRLMLDAKHPMFVFWGPELGFLYNEAYTAFLQDKHPVAIGKPLAQVWPEIWPELSPLIKRTLAGKSVYIENMPFVMFRNGRNEQTWFTFSYSPIYDDHGAVVGVYGTAIDTTSSVTTERRLAFQVRLGDQLRDLLEPGAICSTTTRLLRAELGASRVLFGEITADGEHATFHSNALDAGVPELVGTFRAAAYGKAGFDDLRSGKTGVHNDIAAQLAACDLPAVRNFDAIGARAAISVPVLRNGHLRCILIVHQAAARNWEPYEIELVQDIAERSWNAVERAQAEARLQAAHAQLERLLGERTAERDRIWDIAQDILAIASTDGFFLSCNPALTKVLGWTEAELQATPFSTFAHPDQLGELGGIVARLAAGETITQYEIRSRHRDGAYRWLSWTVVPQGRVLYMAGRDVTEARAQQEALRQTEEALRQAQKMEAIGQLTGGVAHDFNNMLAAMVGNLQLASVHLEAGRVDKLARYIEGAEKVVDRAATLTHRLLAFSRRQTLDPKPTDVELLVSSMLELITRTVGPGITVGTEYASAWRTTYCDPNQLENALLNLAINARDAMPGGGRLLIRTTDAGAGADAFVRISVVDSGSGMAPEVAERAFEPFYTTKPLGQGTGLGLSMVFGFVSQSGGEVHLDSTPGAGTTVSLDLPRHDGEAPGPDLPPQAPGQASPDASPCAGQPRILLVDDEVALREVLAELLRDAGMEVIEAGDGPAALEQLRRLDAIDLLVTDVGLPGMNGRQLADAVRVAAPGTTVLFITGYAESTLGNDFLAPGMHIIVKPFGLAAFAARVAALLAERPARERLA